MKKKYFNLVFSEIASEIGKVGLLIVCLIVGVFFGATLSLTYISEKNRKLELKVVEMMEQLEEAKEEELRQNIKNSYINDMLIPGTQKHYTVEAK
jgi:hypothetical protein